jgi:cysteinyl-tRNA synthetase
MAEKYLGANFDIHGGGLENIFPHNECEIAQSEALSGQPFANYWLHAGSLTVDGVKMSKSLGNSVTIRQALQQYPAEVLRFFMLSSHYRSPLDYSQDALAAAARGWERLIAPALEARRALRQSEAHENNAVDFMDRLENVRAEFNAAMNDDFNTPSALAALFNLTKQVNTLLAKHPRPDNETLQAIAALYKELAGDVLGVLPAESGVTPASAAREEKLIRLLADIRAEARARKDFATSDKIREQLRHAGVTLEDGKLGTTWKIGAATTSD